MVELDTVQGAHATFRGLRHSVKPAIRTLEISLITRIPNVIIIWWESGRLELHHELVERLFAATQALIDRDIAVGTRAFRVTKQWQATRTLDGKPIGGADEGER